MKKRGSALTKVILVIVFLFLVGIGFGADAEETAIKNNDTVLIEKNTEEKENSINTENIDEEKVNDVDLKENISLAHIPEYTEEPYVVINNNIPYFTEAEMTTNSYEFFSELDELKRCGVVHASIGKDLMPTEEREYIGYIKPTGWQVSKYDGIDGAYLYNRCHLIGFQLTGENANAKNLITGTRYMNVQGMLPFENEVANYVKTTDNHVMYRVTPVYDGDNLLASGVLMEAKSVEDNGEGVMFNVYCYNVQPGIEIDYATGTNYKTESEDISSNENGEKQDYVLNVNSKKFHLPDCDGVNQMSEKNKQNFNGYKNDLLSQGYEPCGICKP